MLFEIGDILIFNKNKNRDVRYWIYDYNLRYAFIHTDYDKGIVIDIYTLYRMLQLNQVRVIRQPKNQYAIMGREQITIEEIMG